MTKVRRAANIFVGFLLVLFGLIFVILPSRGYEAVVLFLGVSLAVYGIRFFIFYIRMARFMVGGQAMLYRAVIAFDVGIFTLTLTDVPLGYVVLYLVGLHLFTGGVDIMRALESRRVGTRSWRMQFAHGLVNVIMAALCLIFIRSVSVAVIIYGVGLMYSGVMRIAQAFRRTAIIYIQ